MYPSGFATARAQVASHASAPRAERAPALPACLCSPSLHTITFALPGLNASLLPRVQTRARNKAHKHKLARPAEQAALAYQLPHAPPLAPQATPSRSAPLAPRMEAPLAPPPAAPSLPAFGHYTTTTRALCPGTHCSPRLALHPLVLHALASPCTRSPCLARTAPSGAFCPSHPTRPRPFRTPSKLCRANNISAASGSSARAPRRRGHVAHIS